MSDFGKYGLPKIDEITIELLVGSIARFASSAADEERERLGHAFAAFLIRAITPRDEIWRDLPSDSGGLPKGEDASAAEGEASQSGAEGNRPKPATPSTAVDLEKP